jgi:hypothetical protein
LIQNALELKYQPRDPVTQTLDEDRGYLFEANLCQNGIFIWMAVQTNTNSNTFQEVVGRNSPTSALIYEVEKDGNTG